MSKLNTLLKEVNSSNISKIGYIEHSKQLVVQFKTGTFYKYTDVPKKVYNDFIKANSKGKFLNNIVKWQYKSSKTNSLELINNMKDYKSKSIDDKKKNVTGGQKKKKSSDISGSKKNEIKLRRKVVMDLYFGKGYPQYDIAEQLRVTTRTIESDVAALRPIINKQFEGLGGEDVLKEILNQNKKLKKEYWNMYKSDTDKKNKSIMLKNIHLIDMNSIELFEKAGIIKKIAEKHEISGRLELAELARELINQK